MCCVMICHNLSCCVSGAAAQMEADARIKEEQVAAETKATCQAQMKTAMNTFKLKVAVPIELFQ